jgi:hypothetical protein
MHAQPRCRIIELGLPAGGDGDFRPAHREGLGNVKAQAGRCAGNQNGSTTPINHDAPT